MYSLVSGFVRYVFQKGEYAVLILGLDNAGKTTFLEQCKIQFTKGYNKHSLEKITATVGMNIGKLHAAGVKLVFWDLGGQEELQTLWDKYYDESHAVIFMVDSSDIERIEESKTAFEIMIGNSLLDGVPLLLLINKQDLPGCLTVDQVKDTFNTVARGLGARDVMVAGVSALTGAGVSDNIDWLAEAVKANDIRRPARQPKI